MVTRRARRRSRHDVDARAVRATGLWSREHARTRGRHRWPVRDHQQARRRHARRSPTAASGGRMTAVAKVTTKAPARKIRVILADDHPVVRDGLAAIVNQQADMQVVAEAGDGAEALDLYEQHKPDVMVLDLRMPKMDGAA